MENSEKHIVNTIKSHREEIDANELWANINPHIPKQKKQRRIAGWWTTGILLLIGMWMISAWMIDGSSRNIASASSISLLQKNEGHQNTIANLSKIIADSRIENIQTRNLKRQKSIESKMVENITNNIKTNYNNKLSNKKLTKEKEIENFISIVSSNRKNYNLQRPSVSIVPYFVTPPQKQKEQLSKIDCAPERNTIQKQNRQAIQMTTIGNKYTYPIENIKSEIETPKVVVPKKIVILKKQPMQRWSIFVSGGVSLLERHLKVHRSELEAERDRRQNIESVLGGWELLIGLGYNVSENFIRCKIQSNHREV